MYVSGTGFESSLCLLSTKQLFYLDCVLSSKNPVQPDTCLWLDEHLMQSLSS